MIYSTIPERREWLGNIKKNQSPKELHNYYLKKVMKYEGTISTLLPVPTTDVDWDFLINSIIDMEIKSGQLNTNFFVCSKCTRRTKEPSVTTPNYSKPLCGQCWLDVKKDEEITLFTHKIGPTTTYGNIRSCHKTLKRDGLDEGKVPLTSNWDLVNCEVCLKFKKTIDEFQRRKDLKNKEKEEKEIELLVKVRSNLAVLSGELRKKLNEMAVPDLQKEAQKYNVYPSHWKESLVEGIIKEAIARGECADGDFLCRQCQTPSEFRTTSAKNVGKDSASVILYNTLSLCPRCVFDLHKWSSLSQALDVFLDKAREADIFRSKGNT